MAEEFSEATVMAARRGRTWPQLEIKQALNARLDAKEAFRRYASLVQLPDGAWLETKRIVSMAEAAKSASRHYTAIAAAGESFACAPPTTIGPGNHRVLHGTARSLYCGRLADVRVRGRSQLAERDGEVILDFEADELSGINDQLELDAAVMAADKRHAAVIALPDRGGGLRLGEAFSLLGPNSFAFGHWLAEYLPRLAVALEWGGMSGVPVLADKGMPKQHLECLAALLPPGAQIVEIAPGQQVHVETLWVAPTYYYAAVNPRMDHLYTEEQFLPPPARFARIAAAIRRRFVASLPPSGDGRLRLFLSRNPQGHRRLVNQDAIAAIAASRDFGVVRPEQLSFAAQFGAFEQASHIMGPEGSALFTAFYSRPGARILILNHQHTEMLPAVTALLEACGHEVTVMTGPFREETPDYPHFGDYTIDAPAFTSVVDRWLRAKS